MKKFAVLMLVAAFCGSAYAEDSVDNEVKDETPAADSSGKVDDEVSTGEDGKKGNKVIKPKRKVHNCETSKMTEELNQAASAKPEEPAKDESK
ncbi:MAG: hypothetical protein LBT03_03375 [Holosporales bacterium]|nr:hypothetical protein [Holosporales bacterium]